MTARDFAHYDRLGARSHYHIGAESSRAWDHVREALSHVPPAERRLDLAAVLGVLMKNYPLADRSLVEGVTRSPWMAKPNGEGGWKTATLPFHGDRLLASTEIAAELEARLEAEALGVLDGCKTIGILLSGGMDSRVVAGIVRKLQLSGEFPGTVVAMTWGAPQSRDVNYAAEIARRFKWEFLHFPLNPEVLRQNILLAGERGAEYSPIHLHAMAAIANVEGLDGVLAGSYGDSVGRAEYSGRHLGQIKHILSADLNRFSFLKRAAERLALPDVRRDLAASRARFPGRRERAYREIEMQMHYMRRQLNPCMEVIDDRIPLYQMFGHPDVFGFMWSLAPSCRTNEPYKLLLSRLPGDLLGIPWARNGLPYEGGSGQPADAFTTRNNSYGAWLRRDCREDVLAPLRDGTLQETGLFNERALEMWMRRWPATGPARADRLDEKMAWLASLALFVKQYGIKGASDEPAALSPADELRRMRSLATYAVYRHAAAVVRK